MRTRLTDDVLLTVGDGDMPVDLVQRSSGARVPLSPDEAALAMLLVEGAHAHDLVGLARQQAVPVDQAVVDAFVERLARQDFPMREAAAARVTLKGERSAQSFAGRVTKRDGEEVVSIEVRTAVSKAHSNFAAG